MQENQNKNVQWKLHVSLLNEIRLQKKLSINKVAEISETKQQHVSRFFSCKFEPKLGTYLKFEKIIKNIYTTK